MIYDEDNDIFIGKNLMLVGFLNTAEARWQSPVGDAPELLKNFAHELDIMME